MWKRKWWWSYFPEVVMLGIITDDINNNRFFIFINIAHVFISLHALCLLRINYNEIKIERSGRERGREKAEEGKVLVTFLKLLPAMACPYFLLNR